MEQSLSRNINISAKITAAQKSRYIKIAASLGITLSEWVASILEMYENGYDQFPTLNNRIQELISENEDLKTKLDIANKSKNRFEFEDLIEEGLKEL